MKQFRAITEKNGKTVNRKITAVSLDECYNQLWNKYESKGWDTISVTEVPVEEKTTKTRKKQKYIVTFWRGNMQLSGGGYYTTREIEATSQTRAWAIANKEYCDPVYGTMRVEKVELATA